MTGALLVWWLVVTAPAEAVGRQVGPFESAEQCGRALRSFTEARGSNRAHFGICVQGVVAVGGHQ